LTVPVQASPSSKDEQSAFVVQQGRQDLLGALDANIPLTAVDKVRAAMQGKLAEVFVYDTADHGFNCWARGSYHAASAALAHGRSLQFLATKLF